MTKKRFGSFLPATAPAPAAETPPAPAEAEATPPPAADEVTPTPEAETQPDPPQARVLLIAPPREERRPFSTRLLPSQKAMLDGYVMTLKRAGWPVTQERILEELLRIFEEDINLQQQVANRVAQRSH